MTLALRDGDALLLALVLGAQLLPRAVVMNAGTWLQAEHRLHLQTGYEALTAAVGLALLVALAAADASAAALAAAGVVGPALLLAGLMQRELGRLSLGPSGGPGSVAAVLREAAPLAGALVLVSVYTRIGIVFVNEGASSAEVADFSLAFLFVEQAIVVAGILGAALLPMLALRAARLSAGEDALAADLLLSMTLAGTATGLGLVAFADPLVALLGGDEFRGAVKILRLLAPACAAIFANFFVGYLFVALRRARLYLWFNLAGLVVSVALGLTPDPRRRRPGGRARHLDHRTGGGLNRGDAVPRPPTRGPPRHDCRRWPDGGVGAVRGTRGGRTRHRPGSPVRWPRWWPPALVAARRYASPVTCAAAWPARARRTRRCALPRGGGRSAPRPALGCGAAPAPQLRVRGQLRQALGQLARVVGQ